MSEPKKKAVGRKSGAGAEGKKVARQKLKSGRQETKAPPAGDKFLPPETKAPPTENSQSPTEHMEVHHHPELHHEKRPWKEYLLEALMIFFAVFMGFIAENIREGIDNSEHARQLTLQLVSDLKADTIHLAEIYGFQKTIVKRNDSLFAMLKQPESKIDIKRLQQLAADSHSLALFHPSLGAIYAIKNELHLKQLSNSEIISHISAYEGHIALLHTIEDITLQYQRNYLDNFLCKHFTPANLDAAFDHKPLPDAQMRDLTQEDLTQLGANMVLIRINSNELLLNNKRCMADAVEMLRYVTKQFHLEQE